MWTLAKGLAPKVKNWKKFGNTHFVDRLNYLAEILQNGREAPAAGLRQVWWTLAQRLSPKAKKWKSIMHWKSLARCDIWPDSHDARVTNWPPLAQWWRRAWGIDASPDNWRTCFMLFQSAKVVCEHSCGLWWCNFCNFFDSCYHWHKKQKDRSSQEMPEL